MPVGEKYLAVLWVMPKEGPPRTAPAWLTREWDLIRVGPRVSANVALMNPVPTDVSEPPLPRIFPQVLVRDPQRDWCPYLWGTVSELICMDEHLRFGERYVLPVQSRGYEVVEGRVWWKGLYNGKLLHRVDMKSRRIEGSVGAVADILKGFEAAGFDPRSFIDIRRDIVSRPEETETIDDNLYNTSPEDPAYHMQLLKRLKRLPGSFQFDGVIVPETHRVYFIFRRPLSLVVLRWPEGTWEGVLRIESTDLPAWAHRYQELYVNRLVRWGRDVIAWVSLERGVTVQERVQELQRTDPDVLRQVRPFEGFAPDTITCVQIEDLLMYFRPDRLDSVFSLFYPFKEGRWKPISEPFFIDQAVWVHVATFGKGHRRESSGMARLSIPVQG